MLHFSTNLKFLRQQRNLIQADMLELLGFKPSTWNGYETGNSVPTFKDLLIISEYFDISETDLIHKDLTEGNPIEKRGKKKKYESTTISVTKILQKEPEKEEIIASLKETIEAQKKTIEAQNLTIATLTGEVKRLETK